ncbi:hypothetical protein [Microbacterium lacticum]|uniref:hypothetical protein n=1 Tax=Microbacterium lacticum TaxID=33885 RepID=UPI0028D39BC4|nr:hypothetical protein [Microbacterium lacticum]
MIGWFAIVQIVVATVVAIAAIAAGLAGRRPGDVTVGGMALVLLLLIAQVVIAVVAPLVGNAPAGSPIEFWAYLIGALLIPPLAVFWALVERSRWSTVIMGIAALSVAVMVWRMNVIWTTPAL